MKKMTFITSLVVLMALSFGGCRNKLPVEVPVSTQTSAIMTKYYDDDFHPQYDALGNAGIYIVEKVGVYPRQATASEPEIVMVDPAARTAITRGTSCLRMTLTNVEETWMDWFYYRLELDPKYAYDPDRPDCWAGETGGIPNDMEYGQDWSQYTHFMCDMWINPEKPLHNHKGWWTQIGFYTEMAGWTELWLSERGAVGWDNYYWQHSSAGISTARIGPMKMVWSFNVNDAPASNNLKRWTRLGATGNMCFILGGDQMNLIFGGELYIDNMRVARLEKPFWESFDFMAQTVEWDESIMDYVAVGFSNNLYCYSPLHPDHDEWLADRPYAYAADN